ncbi:MAG: flagellar basal body-associated FliL family protein [bacterium]|nr:flagellar basal body-associated FliL family protein [bacterium]
MAEEEVDEQEEEKAPVPVAPPASLLRYLPIVLVILLLQAGGAYFAITMYLFPDPSSEIQDEQGRTRVRAQTDQPVASVNLGDMVANPRGTGARLLVRTKVVLAVAPKGVVSELQEDINKDRVKDAIVRELGDATYDQLSTEEGREAIKQKMKERINRFLYKGEILEIYFDEFILQAMSGYGKKP